MLPKSLYASYPLNKPLLQTASFPAFRQLQNTEVPCDRITEVGIYNVLLKIDSRYATLHPTENHIV
jgi:hypothetical protein